MSMFDTPASSLTMSNKIVIYLSWPTSRPWNHVNLIITGTDNGYALLFYQVVVWCGSDISSYSVRCGTIIGNTISGTAKRIANDLVEVEISNYSLKSYAKATVFSAGTGSSDIKITGVTYRQ